MDLQTIITALLLSLLAGLSTGIGSALAFFTKHTNTKFLSVALGFSAGVMIYVSFVELFNQSFSLLIDELGKIKGSSVAVISFFTGMFVVALIDRLIPSFENPHESHMIEEMEDQGQAKKVRKLFKMGILTAIVLAIHNFPEGLATFGSAINDIHIGITIAIAVAIHNIPEGIAVSIPIYYATKSRKKAFWYSLASGMAEPLGAILGYFILSMFFNGIMFGVLFAAVAGIMVFVSFDQLLPTAQRYGEHHLSIYGLVSGMGVMAVSLLLFL